MTADHPTIETIADYHSRLLQPQQAASVAAHLSGCADCTAASHAVREVSTILAEQGAEVVHMPDHVATRLDEALRQAGAERVGADRAGSVVPMERRTATTAEPARRTWPLLAAAAAVLVAVGTAVLGDLDLSPGGSADSSVAADAPAQERAGSDGDAGAAAGSGGPAPEGTGKEALETASGPSKHQLPPLSPARLPEYADRLAESPAQTDGNLYPASAPPCAEVSVAPQVSAVAANVVSTVRWRGSPAVVVIDRAARTATVFDCKTASVVLFRTKY